MYTVYNNHDEFVVTCSSERAANIAVDELGNGAYWVWYSA